MIEVIQPGSPVIIGDDISARVVGVWLQDRDVKYQCVWWEGSSRRCEWLELIEVKRTDGTQGIKLGFARAVS